MKNTSVKLAIVTLATGFLSLCSCKKENDKPGPQSSLPLLTCPDISYVRAPIAGTMRFFLTLNARVNSDAQIKYKLIPGTAISPRDITLDSGTVTVPAGRLTASFDVLVTGDSLRQPDLQFTVQLSEPVNCRLGTPVSKGTIITSDGTYLPTDSTGYSTPLSYPGYTLSWSDEFSGKTINAGDWNFEIGGNGWGNNELEYYTDRLQNAFQSNGNLVIEARNESVGSNNYTSARLTTQNKRSFKFGRIDIRAKLPVTKGMWPALWMLGSNISSVSWPACCETDIMELVGLDPSKVYGTGHFLNDAGVRESRGGNYAISGENFSQKFHVFSIVWEQDAIRWLVDDHEYCSMTKASTGTTTAYPFNAPFFFIVNVAVGGDWPGVPDATTNFPQRMFVDYIRVFQ